MPFWVKALLLGMGLTFVAVGALVGVLGTRSAKAHLVLVEGLTPLSAIAFDDQPVGADALVMGVISPRNPAVFRDFVAYVREELDVTTESDGDRRETWRSDGRETPPLALDAEGTVMISNQTYSIEREHELWYDEAKLGFNDRPRDGSERYFGLVAGRQITAFGSVVQGAEGNELEARAIFGGTHAEYLASQRQATRFPAIFGSIFGAVGLLLCAIGMWLVLRR